MRSSIFLMQGERRRNASSSAKLLVDTSTCETGGTGLGLSIVRHVVRNHGGEVTVISREGEGSTFTLILPTRLAVEAALESPR